MVLEQNGYFDAEDVMGWPVVPSSCSRNELMPAGPKASALASRQISLLAGAAASPHAVEAVLRTILTLLTAAGAPAFDSTETASVVPLLDVAETAELLKVSRMTVVRLVDERRMPSVIVRRGKTQKIRRIPRAFIDRLIAEANAGAQVDLTELAKAWMGDIAKHRHGDEASEPSYPAVFVGPDVSSAR